MNEVDVRSVVAAQGGEEAHGVAGVRERRSVARQLEVAHVNEQGPGYVVDAGNSFTGCADGTRYPAGVGSA